MFAKGTENALESYRSNDLLREQARSYRARLAERSRAVI